MLKTIRIFQAVKKCKNIHILMFLSLIRSPKTSVVFNEEYTLSIPGCISQFHWLGIINMYLREINYQYMYIPRSLKVIALFTIGLWADDHTMRRDIYKDTCHLTPLLVRSCQFTFIYLHAKNYKNNPSCLKVKMSFAN